MKRLIRKTIKWYIIAILLTVIGSFIIASTVDAEEKIEVPEEVKQISTELGEQYNICPELIQAVCYVESRFQPDAVNGDCIGIMQVSGKWHRDRMDRLGVTDLLDTKQNMAVAVDYLSELADRYEDIGIVLMIYNGDSHVKDVMAGTAEISDYATEILMLSAELERQNGK